ncbi:MAG TPA: hypothetical protein VG733_17845, partial [Chthoniobacteraceae bacterium]|nr:hypothetical protein [Chthoniobacteraceae bacterium]
MDKKRGFILLAALCLAAIAAAPLHAATPIRNAKSGIVLFRKSGFDSLDKPIVFSRIEQDQAYYDIVTSADYLVHIETDRVVKVVYFLDPTTFPTKFEPEDLAVLKAKADELRALKTLSPAAVQLATSQIQYLQNVFDTETARYKQTAEIAALKFNSEQEKIAFDKKCDLLRLDFLASPGDLAHSEDVIKQMEPLAPRSELLTGFLSKWNEEKTRAL